jgi:hypothetical protein
MNEFRTVVVHALDVTCHDLRNSWDWSHYLQAADATIIARTLIGSNNLQARWVSYNLLETWSCVEIRSGHVGIVPTLNTCYSRLKINYTDKFSPAVGFLDPLTSIVYAEPGLEMPCNTNRFFTIESFGHIERVDQLSGKRVFVSFMDIHELKLERHDFAKSLPIFKAHAFRDWIITDDAVNNNLKIEMMKAAYHASSQSFDTNSNKNHWNFVPENNFGSPTDYLYSLFPSVTPWKIWVSIVCIYISLKIALEIYTIYAQFTVQRGRAKTHKPEPVVRFSRNELISSLKRAKSHPNLMLTINEGELEENTKCVIEFPEEKENSFNSLARNWASFFT